jgi:nitrogen fixation NifU-like protein
MCLDDNDAYRMELLEIYKHPKNFGKLNGFTNSYTESSPVCGDEIKVELKIENDEVKDAKFSGKGCVISMVSSEFLTSKIKGMKVEDIKKLETEDVLDLLKIKNISPSRVKCALVPLKAIQKSI